ncbi:MAG: MraY family glycosyltransferase [Microthrixaceae bacterium]
MLAYVVILAVAFGVTAATVPLVRRFCLRVGLVYEPNERTVHTAPMPALGGLAMFVGFAVALGAATLLGRFKPMMSGTEMAGAALCCAVAFATGLVDDVRHLSAPAKVAGLVLSGSVLSLSGLSLLFFRVPFFDLLVLSPDLSALLTVAWVVGMANAINLIDGLDGLAAGITAIAAAAFLAYSLALSRNGVLDPGNLGPLIAVIVLGVCLGFLPYNVHPAKIIMGDGGALFLGAAMATATIAVGGNSDDPFSGQAWFFFAPLLVPLFILGVPILDTLFSIIRRTVGRSGVSVADRKHLHHRLVDLGHGHRRAVFILWGWTALLSGFVLIPVFTGRGDGIVPIGIAALLLALFTVLGPSAAVRWAGRKAAAEATTETPVIVDGPAREQPVEQPSGAAARR